MHMLLLLLPAETEACISISTHAHTTCSHRTRTVVWFCALQATQQAGELFSLISYGTAGELRVCD